MDRNKNMKSNSWIAGKSQKEANNKKSSKSSTSFKIQMTLGTSQEQIVHHRVSPKDDFAEGRQPWMKLLFDVKTVQKCKSYSTKGDFSKSPVSRNNLLLEPRESSYKLSNLLGDVTFEDWSSRSYLILMTLRDDDNLDSDEQLYNTEASHLDMNEISSENNFESRPTVTSVVPLKKLCQTALATSHLKYQGSPSSETPEHMGICDILRQKETRHLSYSVSSLRDLSKIVVDRLQGVYTNTNSACEKNSKTTYSSSEVSASMISTQRNLCEVVAGGLNQQCLLSRGTEGTVTHILNFEDTIALYNIPSLRHLAEMAIKNHNLSLRDKGPNMPSFDDSRQSYTVPSLRHLTEIVVKGIHLRHRDKLSRLPCLDNRMHFYTVPSLKDLAGIVVKSLHLSSRDTRSVLSSFEDIRQSCTSPSVHDLAEKVPKGREMGSIMPSREKKRHIYTVPSLHDLTEMLVKSLCLNSSEKVSTSSKLETSGVPSPVSDHLITVPSLQHLCQMVVDGVKYTPKEKKSSPSKTNETQQQIPSLLEIKVTRPRIQRQPKVPVSGFPLPTRVPMPQMNFNRPMFPMGSRYSLPHLRPPMTRQPFWGMNRPPPNFWPMGRSGVLPFRPRYGRF